MVIESKNLKEVKEFFKWILGKESFRQWKSLEGEDMMTVERLSGERLSQLDNGEGEFVGLCVDFGFYSE